MHSTHDPTPVVAQAPHANSIGCLPIGACKPAMKLQILDLLLERFHDLTHWLEMANATLPNHLMAGFAASCAVVVMLWLPILCAVLRVVWALAEVGPARKVMTTFFILVLGMPLYPVLVALLLALVWPVMGFTVLTLSFFGPCALGLWFMSCLWEWMEKTVSTQRATSHRMQRRNQSVEKISLVGSWYVDC